MCAAAKILYISAVTKPNPEILDTSVHQRAEKTLTSTPTANLYKLRSTELSNFYDFRGQYPLHIDSGTHINIKK